jgi:hypothetical protein
LGAVQTEAGQQRPKTMRRIFAMKFIRNGAPRFEAITLRLVTVVLGAYALALFAQTAGVFTIA